MKHVSFSQLMVYVRCPEHYLFRYVLGIRRPPTKAQKHGFALHETFAYHFEQKKLDKKGVKARDAKDFFAGIFQSALEDYEIEMEQSRALLTKEYLAKERKSSIPNLLLTGAKGIDVYFKELEPKIKPDLVETAFNFPAGNGIEMVGRLDLTDTSHVIHEMKTTRRTPSQQDINNDPQISIYQEAFLRLKGKPVRGISKDYIVFSKQDSRIVRFQVDRPAHNYATVLRAAHAIMEAVKHNVFYCLHPAESWICSKEWCGYYKLHEELKKKGLAKFMLQYSRS